MINYFLKKSWFGNYTFSKPPILLLLSTLKNKNAFLGAGDSILSVLPSQGNFPIWSKLTSLDSSFHL